MRLKKVALIFNKYYCDGGLDYVKNRLTEEFLKRGAETETPRYYAGFGDENVLAEKYCAALFFDKDIFLAEFFERGGVRVLNSASTVRVCDDKIKTYSALEGVNIRIPKTVISPLMYAINNDTDNQFLYGVSKNLKFPIVVKENTGSQGKQVYLAKNAEELAQLYERLKHIPHHYQRFIGKAKGEDIRIYVVGKKAVASAKRKNTTDFRSNVSMGGKIKIIEAAPEFIEAAELIAARLNLEYGAIDFINDNGPVFIEANSNAYFKAIEAAGVNIAARLADYVLKGE